MPDEVPTPVELPFQPSLTLPGATGTPFPPADAPAPPWKMLPTSPSPAGDRWMNIFHGDETWQGRWPAENDQLLSMVDDPAELKMASANALWIADRLGESHDAVTRAYPMALGLTSLQLLGHMEGTDEEVFRAIGDSLVPTLTMEDITGVREQPLSRLESYVPRSIYLSHRAPELEEAIFYSDLGRKVFRLSWPAGLPAGMSLSDAEAEQIGRQAWREKRAEEKRRKSFENYDEFQLEKTLFGSMAESSLTMAEGPVFWLDKRLELQPGLGYEGTTADTWMNATLGFFEGQRKLAREYYSVDPEFAESYAGKVAGAVGSAVPQLVAMRVPVAAVVGIGGQSFLHAWEDAENTAMRRGEKFDPNRAYAYATTMAALNTALTFLEFKMVLGPWKKGQSELLGDNLIKLFQSAPGSGAVNSVQGGVNDFGTTAFGIEPRNPFDPERRLDDFTVGVGARFVLGAGARMALADIPETPTQRPPLNPGITFADSLGKRDVPLFQSEDQSSIKTSGSSEATSINESAGVPQMKETVPPNVLLSGSESSSASKVLLRSSKDSNIAYSVKNSPESGGLFTLDVEFQQVLHGEAEGSDGSGEVKRGMRAMPVVTVEEGV